jgi:PAS domain S-box-containing protein
MNTLIPRLLIVDDESALMKALCDILETEGYSTTGFTSAGAALEALQQESFDLVLSDLMMPEMDGIELMRRAMEIDPQLVGVVMTGHGTIDTAVRAMQVGALDYILKPFKLTAILPVLTRALTVRRLRLENVQLQEAVGIYKVSTALAFTIDLDIVLQKVAEAAMLQGRASAVSILVPSEEGAETVQSLRIPFTQTLSSWVVRNRELLARFDDSPEAFSISAAPIAEIPRNLSIPMLAGGKLAGILSFTTDEPRRLTAPGQGKALYILASAAASAIERASLIERLRTAELRYRRLTENAPDMVFRYELFPQPCFSYVNPVARTLTGYAPDEYYADHELGLKIVHPEDRHLVENLLRGEVAGEAVTLRCIHRDGQMIWIEQHHMMVHDHEGRAIAIEGIIRDITENKRAEQNIRRSLDEKDVMLHEIHHRVKNNLQIVSSLLNLQADQLPDETSRQVFLNSQNRVQSMALIHQQLYTSSDFAEIDFSTYLRALADHLISSWAPDPTAFRVHVDAAGALLSLEDAVPCGLIVNELISNSLKHAFRGRSSGEIQVTFTINAGECRLTVHDDGTPLPRNLFSNQQATMGVRLIQALTDQLGGQLQVAEKPKFTITFAAREAEAKGAPPAAAHKTLTSAPAGSAA